MLAQQQQMSRVQFGQLFAEGLASHSLGKQPQSAHFIMGSMVFAVFL